MFTRQIVHCINIVDKKDNLTISLYLLKVHWSETNRTTHHRIFSNWWWENIICSKIIRCTHDCWIDIELIEHNLLCVLLSFQLVSIRFKREAIDNVLRNPQQCRGFCTLCAGAGWAASAQLSSCGGCGHLPVETPAGGGGEEQSCRVECFAYNKHSREILMILLDIFPV